MAFLRRWLMRMTAAGWPARRSDARALLSLDDRLLADIGLRRAELAAVVSCQLAFDQLTVHGPIGSNDRRHSRSEPTAGPPLLATERWEVAL